MNTNLTPFPEELWTNKIIPCFPLKISIPLGLVGKGLYQWVQAYWEGDFKKEFGEELFNKVRAQAPAVNWPKFIHALKHQPHKVWKWVNDQTSKEKILGPTFSNKHLQQRIKSCTTLASHDMTASCAWNGSTLIGSTDGGLHLITPMGSAIAVCNLWNDLRFNNLLDTHSHALSIPAELSLQRDQAVQSISSTNGLSFRLKVGCKPLIQMILDPRMS